MTEGDVTDRAAVLVVALVAGTLWAGVLVETAGIYPRGTTLAATLAGEIILASAAVALALELLAVITDRSGRRCSD